MMRFYLGLFCLCISLFAAAQDDSIRVPFRDFIAISVEGVPDYWPSSEDIVLRNIETAKHTETIVVNRTGLVIHGKTACTWAINAKSSLRGPLGYTYSADKFESLQKSKSIPCPSQSPIQAATDYNYSSSSVDVLNEILVHITKIDEDARLIEVPFNKSIYRGIIPDGFGIKLNPGKGTEIANAAALRQERLRKQRAAELDKLGVNKVRAAILKCITEKQGAACFQDLLPAGKDYFEHNSLGGIAEECKALRSEETKTMFTIKEALACFKLDSSFRTDFISCIKGTGSQFRMDSEGKKQVLELIPDNALEMFWECKFVQENGRWIFHSMSWSGC